MDGGTGIRDSQMSLQRTKTGKVGKTKHLVGKHGPKGGNESRRHRMDEQERDICKYYRTYFSCQYQVDWGWKTKADPVVAEL